MLTYSILHKHLKINRQVLYYLFIFSPSQTGIKWQQLRLLCTILHLIDFKKQKMFAKAFYNIDNAMPSPGINVAAILGSMVSSLTNPVGAMVGETSNISAVMGSNMGNSLGLSTLPEQQHDIKTVQPKSGLVCPLHRNKQLFESKSQK